MTRFRFIQIAFPCLALFVLMFVLAAILDATWLRVASIPLLFTGGFAYYIWRWWGLHRVILAISGGLLLALIAAGFVTQLVS